MAFLESQGEINNIIMQGYEVSHEYDRFRNAHNPCLN